MRKIQVNPGLMYGKGVGMYAKPRLVRLLLQW